MAELVTVQGEPDPIKKNVARRLINRGWMRWVVRGKVAKRLGVRERPLRAGFGCRRFRYVPDKMPLLELPGMRFQPPTDARPKFPDKVFPDLPAL